MLTVAVWVVVWVLVFAGAGLVLFLIGRSVFRKAMLLLNELSLASEQLSQVSGQLQELVDRSADPAVFASPSALRQQRYLSGREAGAKKVKARPAAQRRTMARTPPV